MVNEQSTEGYDYQYDSHFLPLYAPQFYSQAGSEKLSTNSLPILTMETMIPFGFVKNNASSFSIELKENITGYKVYLKDLKTNTDQNLTDNPVYNFTSLAGDNPNRFMLHFINVTSVPNLEPEETFSLSVNSGNITITMRKPVAAEIRVNNMLGQVVITDNTNGKAITSINANRLQNGIYIISLIENGKRISKKLVLSR